MFKKFLTLGTTAFLLYAGSTQAQMSFSKSSVIMPGYAPQGGPPNFDPERKVLPTGLAIADMNGDGKLDIVASSGRNWTAEILTASGTNVFSSYKSVGDLNNPANIVVADFDKNGFNDIVSLSNSDANLKIALSSAYGVFGAATALPGVASLYSSIKLGYLNEDTYIDMIVSGGSSGNILIYMNNSVGGFNQTSISLPSTASKGLAIGDVNNDGKNDIILGMTNSPGSIRVFTGTGTGTFTLKSSFNLGTVQSPYEPYDIEVGDLNEDGNIDIAVANNGGNMSIITGTGNGMFGSPVQYSSGVQPYAIAMGDLNGDNKPDLAVCNYNGANVSVFTNNGNATFAAAAQQPTGVFGVWAIEIADLNTDGKNDIIVTNNGATSANHVNVFSNTTTQPQTITGFDLISSAGYGAIVSTPLNGTASSGLPVTFTSSNSSLASVIGANLFIYGAGSFTITASQAGNNTFAGTSVAKIIEITKANLTITSYSAMQTYGDNSTFTGTLLGIVNNDVLTQVFANQSMQNVGVITNGIITNATGTKIANYNRIFNTGTLTIVAANLTVTGTPLTKTYGAANPIFTSTGIGFKNFDNLNGGINISYGTVPANADAGVYEYAVSLSGPDLGNYIVTTVAGTLTINKANLSVIGNNFSKVYGTNNPTFTTVNTGITNGNVLSVTIAPLATNTGVGVYNLPFEVSVSGSGLVNYNVTTMPGVLTITKANLNVTAQSFSRLINRANPIFTTSTTGLVDGEMLDISVLTTVTINSPQGVYALVPSVTGATLSNYNLTTVAGTITVLCTVPSIVGTINASNQCVGVSYTFTANGRGTDIVYTWKNSLGEEVSNASTFTTTMAGVYTVSISGACGSFVYNSSVIRLDTIATPKFLVQPVSSTYCPSTSATLTVTVAGAANGQLRWSNGTNFTNNIAVSTPGTYNVTFVGNCGTVISNSVTVNSLLGTAIVGTSASKSVCEGKSVGLEITALGDNLAYNWSDGSTNATNNSTVSGLNSATYTVTVSGTCGTLISSDIIITPISAVKINSISSSATICGDNLPYSLDANFSGDGILYKWSNGETSSFTSANTGGDYYLTVTGTCGSYISTAIGINVVENTRIVTQPVAVTACEGTNATFTVSAVGGNLSYVWNGNANANATTYSTTTTGSSIFVRVSGTCGIANSNDVNYIGILKTVIQSAPQSQALSSETDLRNLSVFAQGDQLGYIWSSGETTSMIMNKGVGTYTVTVSGTCGSEIRSAFLALTQEATVTGISTLGDVTTTTSPVSVTIVGFYLLPNAQITINNTVIFNYSVIDINTIVAEVPAGVITSTSVNINVVNQNQIGGIVQVPVTIKSTLTNVQSFNSQSIEMLLIVPNPSTGTFKVSGGKSITIYDVIGNVVLKTNETSFTIASKGLFIAQVETENGVKFVKLVVE